MKSQELVKTLALLNSMILSGEQHSETSLKAYKDSIDSLRNQYEYERQINNKLSHIILAADKIVEHKNEIYNLVNELKTILNGD